MRRASRLVRDALARVSREYRARVPASAPSTSAPSRALDRPDASPSRASSPSRALFASARAAVGKTTRRRPSHAPVRAEELRYDRVVAVEDASRALEPEEGTLYGTPPKTWVEREDASWDDAQAKAVDEMFASYDSERKYVRGSGMPTLEEVLAGERAAETETGEAAAAAADAAETAETGEEEEEDKDEDEDAVDSNAPLARVPVRDAAGRSYGTGKRKTAVARVWLAPGAGEHKVNGKPYDEYFPSPSSRAEMVAPFFVSGTLGMFTLVADVRGGGISGQAQAIRHGVSVALQNYDPAFRPALKAAGYLRRDSRVVERKKPGKAKARKSFAWVKR